MRSAQLVALAAFAALAPAGIRAQDWQQQDYGQGPYEGSEGYDVSVDLPTGESVNFETFEQPLAPYGDWVVAGNYGRVWRPRVAAGWRPYYYGRWEWTNEGWFWVSDEPWGWAAYHYGRWAYDPYYGWVWVPGYEWAPAWVSWRYSGDVVGWAPLAPGLSVYVSTYPFVDNWWTFVPCTRFVSVPVYTVAYAPAYTRRWFYQTAPAPARPVTRGDRPAPAPTPAWGGPAPRLIAERTGRAPMPARIVPSPAPGVQARPGEIAVFRPGVRGSPPPRGGGWGRGGAEGGAPGYAGRPGWAPPGGYGRGPGVAPAPGRGGAVVGTPPNAGNGRGPGPAPAPGWSGRGSPQGGPPPSPPSRSDGRHGAVGAPPNAGSGRGSGPAAPGWSGRGSPQGAPPASPPSRSDGGHGGGGGGGGQGGGGGGGGQGGGSHGGRGEPQRGEGGQRR